MIIYYISTNVNEICVNILIQTLKKKFNKLITISVTDDISSLILIQLISLLKHIFLRGITKAAFVIFFNRNA